MRIPGCILLAAFLLSACDDRGTAPSGTGSMGAGASGSSGSTNSSDTSSSDTSSTDTPLDTVSLDGPVTIEAGSQRRIVFYFPDDRQLHFLASSDGAVAGTYDRETVWDVGIASSDTIYDTSIVSSTIENGFVDGQGLSSSRKTASFRLYTVTRATEAMVQGRPGDTLTVTVTAYSEIIPNPATANAFPALLPTAATDTLVYVGSSSKPLGKVKFRAILPSH